MKNVFISYLHSEADDEKLDHLIKLLEQSGIHVVIDERDLEIGDDLPLFMEKNLVESDYIIVILTSGYKKRADSRQGGVGYEASIMAASLSKNEAVISSRRGSISGRSSLRSHLSMGTPNPCLGR